MANEKSSRKKRQSGFPPAATTPKTPRPKNTGTHTAAPGRWGLKIMFLVVAVGGTYLAIWMKPPPEVPRLTYEIVNTYPHDTGAFTQGLLFHDGALYESTGKKGQSSLRKVDLKTGQVQQQIDLPDDVFAEGLAIANDKFYQLTWQNNLIYVYDRDFKLLKTVEYPHQGWGLTFDGKHLIASDGTRMLYFLDPETLEEQDVVGIKLGGRSAGNVNELEFVGRDIYANVYQTDEIYCIDKASGNVRAIASLAGLWPRKERTGIDQVLNGIAIDPETDRIWVTGKNAPHVWEIKLVSEGSR